MFWGMKLNVFSMVMYLAMFANAIIPFAGLILPIVMWVTNKDKDASGTINRHGQNILNMMISFAIYFFVSGLLILVLIGFITTPLLAILWVVFVIMAAIKANNGVFWPIPYCIRFFK